MKVVFVEIFLALIKISQLNTVMHKAFKLLHDGGSYQKANQWTGFYMIRTSATKELKISELCKIFIKKIFTKFSVVYWKSSSDINYVTDCKDFPFSDFCCNTLYMYFVLTLKLKMVSTINFSHILTLMTEIQRR